MSLVEIVVSMVLLAVIAAAISSTLGLVTSKKMRSSSGSLEIQAASYARQTLEELRSAVSTNSVAAAALESSDAGVLHDHTSDPLLLPGTNGLPTGDLLTAGATRTYTVSNVPGTNLRKVKVTVQWTDPA